MAFLEAAWIHATAGVPHWYMVHLALTTKIASMPIWFDTVLQRWGLGIVYVLARACESYKWPNTADNASSIVALF